MDDQRSIDAWSVWQRQPLPLRISVTLGAAVLFIVIWWLVPPMLYPATSDGVGLNPAPPDAATRIKAITDTRTALLAGLVGVGALGTFWVNSHNAGLNTETLRVSQESFRLAEENHKHTIKDATERRVTELYTKAADQLGSDKAPVRLAGLYALERLAQDNPTQRQTIVNVVCAYLQMPYTPPVEPSAASTAAAGSDGPAAEDHERYLRMVQEQEKRTQEQRVRTTAQRILHQHLIVNVAPEENLFRWEAAIDLAGAYLTGANFSGAQLAEASLYGADLRWSSLWRANLSDASLSGADLTGAVLDKANLTGADLREVNLGKAQWDSETIWPPRLRDEIQAASAATTAGRYRVKDGYRIPKLSQETT